MTEKQKIPRKGKALRLVLAALVGIALGLGVWTAYQYRQITIAQAAALAAGKYQTTTVKKGTLSISVSGSGQAIDSQSADLGFATSGTIAKINVKLGDQVTKGQDLAVQGGLDALQLAVDEQTVAVQSAQLALDEVKNNPDGALAKALSAQASAQSVLVDAQNNLHDSHDGRCSTATTQSYYQKYLDWMVAARSWQDRLGKSNEIQKQYVLEHLNPILKQMELAYQNYLYCQAYTPQEILNSQANLQVAKASLAYYQEQYQALVKENGLDAASLAAAEATLKNAQLQLETAQKNLAGATIVAPFDGTVTAVNGTVGQTSGTGAVLTISDLTRPEIQITIDETDLSNFAVGCPAQVTFNAQSTTSYSGVVSQVSPTLVSVQSVSMVEGLVSLEKSKLTSGKAIAPGMDATVMVTCQSVDNALKVPVEALYEPSGASPYVYVLNALGKPEKREVTVGLKTVASVEIKTGLTEGEQVILTQIKSQ